MLNLQQQNTTNTFLQDVLQGLQSENKSLPSKYFYDETGDKIFQKIMDCPEYYVTKCEMEIFMNKADRMADTISYLYDKGFDIVELGAGDAVKSLYLLKALWKKTSNFTYFPIDISEHAINDLLERISKEIPGLGISGIVGEYMTSISKANDYIDRPKLVLFLGSSIGNFTIEETNSFFQRLRTYMRNKDMLITGFDLKKSKDIILPAYNDNLGITKLFNINLLTRINNTFGANFNISKFDHQPEYDELTGECKSYLVSQENQNVEIERHIINFSKGERIFMEISQKYSQQEIDDIATNSYFNPIYNYYDQKIWFVDALWECH